MCVTAALRFSRACASEAVGAVVRGRANAQKADMSRALAPFAVELSPTCLDEITIHVIIEKVRCAVVAALRRRRGHPQPSLALSLARR
jgi:hypothetical protein